MKKTLFVLSFLTCLLGCSSTKEYEALLDTWMGSSKKDLVSKWGNPNNEYKTDDDTTLLEYYESRVGGCSENVFTYYCNTTFTLKKDKIMGWEYQGNRCRAHSSKTK